VFSLNPEPPFFVIVMKLMNAQIVTVGLQLPITKRQCPFSSLNGSGTTEGFYNQAAGFDVLKYFDLHVKPCLVLF
jgi:hypothetical protein